MEFQKRKLYKGRSDTANKVRIFSNKVTFINGLTRSNFKVLYNIFSER